MIMSDQLQKIKLMLASIEVSQKIKEKHYYRTKSNGKEYFYCRFRVKGALKRDYLGASGSDKVVQAKVEQMKLSLTDALTSDRELIEDFIKKYRRLDIRSLEESISPCLRDVPIDFVADENVKELWDWANADYKRNRTPFGKKEIYALDGVRVRSKGECIWYNDFRNLWVPMRYDPVMELVNPKPGVLGPGQTVWKSPDFLIKCIDGTYIIVEHLGFVMDDGYSEDFRQKMQIYEANGFQLGVNF